jgi:hypothetical protein
MSTKSREVIWGSRIRGDQIRADGAPRERCPGSSGRARGRRGSLVDPDEGYGGPPQPSPTIAQYGGYGWLEVKCKRCETKASIPLEHVRRPRNTPIWKLEAALECRSCRTPRYSPPVRMIKLTKQREVDRICGCIRTSRGEGAALRYLRDPRTPRAALWIFMIAVMMQRTTLNWP